MKFYQKRGFALVVLILAIIGSGVYGISKKPAALPEVSYYNWICDEAGLLDQETRQTIQDYNTAWNKQYYAVVAVAAVDDIRGWSSEDYAREHYIDQWQQTVDDYYLNFYVRNPEYLEMLPEQVQLAISNSLSQVRQYNEMPLKIYKAEQLVGGEEAMDQILHGLFNRELNPMYPYLTYQEFLDACGLTEEDLNLG